MRRSDIDEDVPPCVSGLDTYECPLHISAFVVPVDIDPVEAVLRTRTQSHVAEKVRQRTPLRRIPLRTDGDPATAIMLELTVLLVETPPEHRPPDAIFSRLTQSMRPSTAGATTETATAFASAEVLGSHGLFCAAVTPDPPHCRMRFRVPHDRAVKHDPPSEPLATKVSGPTVHASVGVSPAETALLDDILPAAVAPHNPA